MWNQGSLQVFGIRSLEAIEKSLFSGGMCPNFPSLRWKLHAGEDPAAGVGWSLGFTEKLFSARACWKVAPRPAKSWPSWLEFCEMRPVCLALLWILTASYGKYGKKEHDLLEVSSWMPSCREDSHQWSQSLPCTFRWPPFAHTSGPDIGKDLCLRNI